MFFFHVPSSHAHLVSYRPCLYLDTYAIFIWHFTYLFVQMLNELSWTYAILTNTNQPKVWLLDCFNAGRLLGLEAIGMIYALTKFKAH